MPLDAYQAFGVKQNQNMQNASAKFRAASEKPPSPGAFKKMPGPWNEGQINPYFATKQGQMARSRYDTAMAGVSQVDDAAYTKAAYAAAGKYFPSGLASGVQRYTQADQIQMYLSGE